MSVAHVAALVSCIPLGSSVLEAMDPKNRYTETDWLLLGILNSLRKEPFDPFTPIKRKANAMSPERLREILSRPRKEMSDVH